MTPAERASLAALAEAATPGPWEVVHEHAGHHVALVGDLSIIGSDAAATSTASIDAAVIVDAVNALPSLLSALDAAEADRDTWRSVAADIAAERDRLRERVRLAEAWLAADDAWEAAIVAEFGHLAVPSEEPLVRASDDAREAFRASKGGE